MLLAMADRRLGIAERSARCFPDRRDPLRITYMLADMVRARILAIACGYQDADDLDALRADPAFKLACGRLPDTGANLCSQPTLSRLENAPSLQDAIRLTWALVDQWMASDEREPALSSFSISTTPAMSYTGISNSLFNAHYDQRCFLPIHVYDTDARVPSRSCCAPAKPRRVSRRAPICAGSCAISANVGPGRASPSGADGQHQRRPEAMELVRGQPHRLRLRAARFEAAGRKSTKAADAVRTERALSNKPVVRGYAETRHKAKSWSRGATRRRPHRSHSARARHPFRRHQRRIRRRRNGFLRRPLLRARAGREPHQAAQERRAPASDRTSCRSAIANQVRLALHTAAYWLMLTVRDAIPKPRDLANAEFLYLAYCG